MLKILTIDDSRVMRQMLEATLSGAGHTAIQAVDGQEGLVVVSLLKLKSLNLAQ